MESEMYSQYEDNNKKKTSLGVKVLVALNALVLALIVVTYVVGIRVQKRIADTTIRNNTFDNLFKEFEAELPDIALPSAYAPPYINPATDQAHRGTCWCWSTLYNLETQYREQGIKKGFLDEKTFVKFSIQAFVSVVGNYCRAHPTEKACGYGGFKRNSTNDNQVEAFPYFLKMIQGLDSSVVADQVCPYVPDPSPVTDFQCDNFYKQNESNPIRFNFKGMTTVYDTRAIKQLLFLKKHPLGIGTPLGTINFYAKCSEAPYSNHPHCQKKVFRCPDSQTEEYCALLEFQGRTKDGTFVGIDKADRQTEFGGHAMNVVGYNDNWRYNSRISSDKSVQPSKGCLILHNSWRADGHSVQYLLGNRTLENEQVLCPNVRAPENWIPATLDCVKKNKDDPSKCSKDILRVRGNGTTHGADIIKCTSTDTFYCDQNLKYILKRKSDDDDGSLDVYELDNGLHDIGFIAWSDTQEPMEVRIKAMPFWGIDRYMTPENVEVENNADECGFYALPYQVIENMRRRSFDLFDNFKSSDYEVEFLDSSYINAKVKESYNYDWLKSSTQQQNLHQFNEPIPFYVYH
ncbi:hypothetical protein TVAG_144390 [Trichomonas vaginalis G3]|uniref:Peptidase C1A papain C-terminal domain-containing protein n=1 Tax=Trichomonas vaginalis (strain ATCC PRA-98 / G3) TaxID=412133 RepID=A2FHD2_TRIV3|nr:papain family cysteine protease domain containing protein family [Trichomonas vaginalis G3]EAX95690.1 hypothetical protein TVAG_144390 [Trichomonas vaginalis G3]KAI5546788.1 papain family cysteine protease domain containing protein family [Trichomonas vaginalis G3]|eukprot:XP_001308620.1 hypothetical protein [Trichomonas vaginalis G3]